MGYMDKTTKNFVIFAWTIVIAPPSVWLGWTVIQQEQLNMRRFDRERPCRARAKADWPLPIRGTDDIIRKGKWVEKCQNSTLPVDQVEFPPS